LYNSRTGENFPPKFPPQDSLIDMQVERFTAFSPQNVLFALQPTISPSFCVALIEQRGNAIKN
jgi:hypothetical protein